MTPPSDRFKGIHTMITAGEIDDTSGRELRPQSQIGRRRTPLRLNGQTTESHKAMNTGQGVAAHLTVVHKRSIVTVRLLTETWETFLHAAPPILQALSKCVDKTHIDEG